MVNLGTAAGALENGFNIGSEAVTWWSIPGCIVYTVLCPPSSKFMDKFGVRASVSISIYLCGIPARSCVFCTYKSKIKLWWKSKQLTFRCNSQVLLGFGVTVLGNAAKCLIGVNF